jgi:hypothetical protein
MLILDAVPEYSLGQSVEANEAIEVNVRRNMRVH